MIDFPTPTFIGQTFNAPNGIQYIWDGTTWNVSSNVMLTADSFNRVVNGALQVSQENGNTGGSANGYYPADQWSASVAGITLASCQRQIAAGVPYQISMAPNVKASLGATDFLMFLQRIEGQRVQDLYWGTANAKQVILRFDAHSALAGTYSYQLRNGTALNRSYVGNFTLAAATWTTITAVIPGDTTGTWPVDNTAGLDINVTYASGTTYIAPALGWNAGNFIAGPGVSNGAASGTPAVYIRNIGLYADPLKTGVPPPWQQPQYEAELASCQRYWRLWDQWITSVGYGNASGQMLDNIQFAPTMRIAPTVAYLSPAYNNSSNFRNNAVMTYLVRPEATQTAAGSAWAIANVTCNARM